MSFYINCEHCAQKFEAEDEHIGAQLQCPMCFGVILISKPENESDAKIKNPLDVDHADVFDMSDGEEIDLGSTLKNTIGNVKSNVKTNVTTFRSLDYGYLLPFKKIFNASLLKKKAVRWVLFLGLTPLIIISLVNDIGISYTTVLWLFQIYFCCFWGLYFYSIIQPGKDLRKKAVLYGLFTAVVGIPLMLAIEDIPAKVIGNWENGWILPRAVFYILVVGLFEETCKALPLLLFGIKKGKIMTPREGMFLGFVSGCGFAAAEGVQYCTNTSENAQILQIMFRMMTGPMIHGAWAGIVGWFIGIAATKSTKWPIIIVGIFSMAILHGMNDTVVGMFWGIPHVAIEAISMLMFMAYLVHGEEKYAEEAHVRISESLVDS